MLLCFHIVSNYFIQVHPDWNIFHNFAITEVREAFHADVQPEAHPMTFHVESPESIESLFDDITYSKGSLNQMQIFRRRIKKTIIINNY